MAEWATTTLSEQGRQQIMGEDGGGAVRQGSLLASTPYNDIRHPFCRARGQRSPADLGPELAAAHLLKGWRGSPPLPASPLGEKSCTFKAVTLGGLYC